MRHSDYDGTYGRHHHRSSSAHNHGHHHGHHTTSSHRHHPNGSAGGGGGHHSHHGTTRSSRRSGPPSPPPSPIANSSGGHHHHHHGNHHHHHHQPHSHPRGSSRDRSPDSSIMSSSSDGGGGGRSSPGCVSDCSHERTKSRMRWILSLGLLLPALAAIIGVVAWAVSAEVVMGARRDSVFKSTSASSLDNRFHHQPHQHYHPSSSSSATELKDPLKSQPSTESSAKVVAAKPQTVVFNDDDDLDDGRTSRRRVETGFKPSSEPPRSRGTLSKAAAIAVPIKSAMIKGTGRAEEDEELSANRHDDDQAESDDDDDTHLLEEINKPKPELSAKQIPSRSRQVSSSSSSANKDLTPNVIILTAGSSSKNNDDPTASSEPSSKSDRIKSTGAQIADVIDRLVAQRKNGNSGKGGSPHIVVVAPRSSEKKKSSSGRTTARPSKTATTSKATTTTTTTTTMTTTKKPQSKLSLSRDADTLLAAVKLLSKKRFASSRMDDNDEDAEDYYDEKTVDTPAEPEPEPEPVSSQKSTSSGGGKFSKAKGSSESHSSGSSRTNSDSKSSSSRRSFSVSKTTPPDHLQVESKSVISFSAPPPEQFRPMPQQQQPPPPQQFQGPPARPSINQLIQAFKQQQQSNHPSNRMGQGPAQPNFRGHLQGPPPPHFQNAGFGQQQSQQQLFQSASQPVYSQGLPPPQPGQGPHQRFSFNGPPPPGFQGPMPPPGLDLNAQRATFNFHAAETGPNGDHMPAESGGGHGGDEGPNKGLTLHFGGGPIGGGGQIMTSPMGIIKTLLLPLLPKPRMNLNGKVVFGVVLEKGVGFGKQKSKHGPPPPPIILPPPPHVGHPGFLPGPY